MRTDNNLCLSTTRPMNETLPVCTYTYAHLPLCPYRSVSIHLSINALTSTYVFMCSSNKAFPKTVMTAQLVKKFSLWWNVKFLSLFHNSSPLFYPTHSGPVNTVYLLHSSQLHTPHIPRPPKCSATLAFAVPNYVDKGLCTIFTMFHTHGKCPVKLIFPHLWHNNIRRRAGLKII